ncbi:GNAT family N-acetyltransferase [bacterium]|jgi:GNAT superfamily N-acetyltransferase|nr:GNAT family N-acetyltransferase [bacterium]
MSIAYYKRFRMEIDLEFVSAPIPLPAGYRWVSWDWSVLEYHAWVKFCCFRTELDARIFPCLGEHDGCIQLMRDIASRRGFVPEATWLIARGDDYVGTVQGVIDYSGMGMIQNLGIVPEVRNLGLGTTLLIQSLNGFRRCGMNRGMLEVTADNIGAVRLYRRLGFRRARTLYRAVDEPK